MTTATSIRRVGVAVRPAPTVIAFTIMPRRFAVDAVPPAFFYVELDPPLVGRVRRLDNPVEVAIAIERHGRGGGLVPMGSLYHVAARGMNIPRFTGRVGGRPLAPGAYRASITAGDDGFPPMQVDFRIVP